MHPLARARDDWAALVAAARRWPLLRTFGEDVVDEEVRLLLKAPVAVAWWITTFAPELATRDRLDLLIVGLPGGPAAADEGRPYQLVPHLLERPALEIVAAVILWAPEARVAPRVAFATPQISLDGDAVARAATMFDGSIADWLAQRGGRMPDLCLLMHPGFDARIEFWRGLRDLLLAGVPIGCFARGMEKVERDVWLLAAYGYDVTPDPHPNPWARRHAALRGHGAWGAVGWRLAPRRLPPADAPIDRTRLRRAFEAQRFLQHEFEVWNPLRFIGQVHSDGGDPALAEGCAPGDTCIGLPDHHAMSLQTGEVWAVEPEGRVPLRGNVTLPPAVRATFPGEDAPGFERMLWAVEVYRDEIRPREARALAQLGASDVERLRTELASALRGTASNAEIDAFTDYYRGGASPAPPTPGSGPLFAALRQRDWKEAAVLIARTPSLVEATDEDGRTPLFYAMGVRYDELARTWLEANAHPDHLDHEGFAVIHDLAKRDDPAPIELLQRYGADLDLGTGMGFTPALLALRYRCWKVLGYLLAQGVDLRKTALAGTSVADQYEAVDDLPRVLRLEIDQQLGKRRVIPIAAPRAR